VAAAGAALTRRLAAEPDLAQAVSYWATGAPALKSRDGGQALVIGRITGDEQDLDTRAAVLDAAYPRDDPTLRVQVGGQAQVFREVGEQVEADLARAEAIAVPITLVLLVLVFASAVAGALPLAVGGFAIVGALVVLPALLAVLGRPVDRFRLTLGRRLQGPLAAAGDAAVPAQARRFAAADGTWLSVVPSVEPSSSLPGCPWTTRCSCCPGSRRSTTAPATPSPRSGWSGPAASSPPRPPCWAIVFVVFATSQSASSSCSASAPPWPSWSTPP
jgi:hypothetical protein